jgi:transposase
MLMPLIFHNHEEFKQELILRARHGFSIRSLAKTFEIARNTVRKILRDHAQDREVGHEILPCKQIRSSKLDAFKPRIEKLLEKYPKITGQRMLEELQPDGYEGGITILREHLKIVRAPEIEPVIRFETQPGQQGMMDWSPYKLRFTREGLKEIQCFSYVLGFSRRHFIDFTPRRDFYTLIRRHQDAFTHFGGVPKECLYDSEKTVVLRWEAGRPVFSPPFTAFITHYDCRPLVCSRGRPQTKGKVEAPFKYVEGNLLCARDFADLEDLRAMARWWLAEKSDRHKHDTTGRPPLEMFLEEEQTALRPLPACAYDSAEVALCVCHAHGFVRFETNWYSVPTGHIADILSVKGTEKEIQIYSPELELLARHERLPAGSGAKAEDPGHHQSKRDKYGLEPVREAFLALGPAAEEFLKGLVNKFPKNCGFQARGILNLKADYLSQDIERALKHALRYQAFESTSIERILKARATPRPLESVRNKRARQVLEKTLPKITQRPLSEYGALLKQEDESHGNESRNTDEDQDPSPDPETDGDATGS